MSDELFRAIVGVQASPLRKIDKVPAPYRQTQPAPLVKHPEPPKQPENPSK